MTYIIELESDEMQLLMALYGVGTALQHDKPLLALKTLACAEVVHSHDICLRLAKKMQVTLSAMPTFTLPTR